MTPSSRDEDLDDPRYRPTLRCWRGHNVKVFDNEPPTKETPNGLRIALSLPTGYGRPMRMSDTCQPVVRILRTVVHPLNNKNVHNIELAVSDTDKSVTRVELQTTDPQYKELFTSLQPGEMIRLESFTTVSRCTMGCDSFGYYNESRGLCKCRKQLSISCYGFCWIPDYLKQQAVIQKYNKQAQQVGQDRRRKLHQEHATEAVEEDQIQQKAHHDIMSATTIVETVTDTEHDIPVEAVTDTEHDIPDLSELSVSSDDSEDSAVSDTAPTSSNNIEDETPHLLAYPGTNKGFYNFPGTDEEERRMLIGAIGTIIENESHPMRRHRQDLSDIQEHRIRILDGRTSVYILRIFVRSLLNPAYIREGNGRILEVKREYHPDFLNEFFKFSKIQPKFVEHSYVPYPGSNEKEYLMLRETLQAVVTGLGHPMRAQTCKYTDRPAHLECINGTRTTLHELQLLVPIIISDKYACQTPDMPTKIQYHRILLEIFDT